MLIIKRSILSLFSLEGLVHIRVVQQRSFVDIHILSKVPHKPLQSGVTVVPRVQSVYNWIHMVYRKEERVK